MTLTTTGTVLSLTGITLRNYSARRLKLQSSPIDPGELAFDVNGDLHDLTMTQFRKMSFTLTCEDTDAPELDDVWKGKEVTMVTLPRSGFAVDSEENQRSFDCLLSSWSTNVDEWGAQTGWTLVLLER